MWKKHNCKQLDLKSLNLIIQHKCNLTRKNSKDRKDYTPIIVILVTICIKQFTGFSSTGNGYPKLDIRKISQLWRCKLISKTKGRNEWVSPKYSNTKKDTFSSQDESKNKLQNESSKSSDGWSKKLSSSLDCISLNKARSSSFSLKGNPLSRLRPRLWLSDLGSLPGELLNDRDGGISTTQCSVQQQVPPQVLYTIQVQKPSPPQPTTNDY